MMRRRPFGLKFQLEMMDYPVHHGIVGEERDDLHRGTALGTEEGINFIDFADHPGLALGRRTPELLLHHPKRESLKARFPDLPPMDISIQPIISYRDLPLSGI